MNKNAFAGAASMFQDSDDEGPSQKTKTQVKKDKNKIAEAATAKPAKEFNSK